jgi:hypothetical protein
MLAMLVFFSCTKDVHSVNDNTARAIQSAKAFFTQSVATAAATINRKNYRASQLRSLRWDMAQRVQLSIGDAVVVPIVYKSNLYISSEVSGASIFNLNDLTSLVIYKDSTASLHFGVVTYIPDTVAIQSHELSSGIIMYEDWFGNSLAKPRRFSANYLEEAAGIGGSSNSIETDVVQSIQVCNEVDGYNYSPDDPEGGITTWSETTCTTYGFQNNYGPSFGARNLPGIFGTRISAVSTVLQGPPKNPIGDIADYLKCFTPGDNGQQFTVTLAVEQPSPGTRQPWSFTTGWVGGSIDAGNAVNVGHTWLIFKEVGVNGTTIRNVGFFPQEIVSPSSPGAPGILSDDEGTPYNVCLTMTVNSSQFFSIASYVSQGTASVYNLNSYNCTSFAVDALATAAINIPATVGTWIPNGKGLDPGDLGEDIAGMPTTSTMKPNTTGTAHPNQGSCN